MPGFVREWSHVRGSGMSMKLHCSISKVFSSSMLSGVFAWKSMHLLSKKFASRRFARPSSKCVPTNLILFCLNHTKVMFGVCMNKSLFREVILLPPNDAISRFGNDSKSSALSDVSAPSVHKTYFRLGKVSPMPIGSDSKFDFFASKMKTVTSSFVFPDLCLPLIGSMR